MAMKNSNLYEATQKLVQAREAILKQQPVDSSTHLRQYQDLDVLLLEHDKPELEVFPDKQNMKPIKVRLRGDSTAEHILKLLGDQ